MLQVGRDKDVPVLELDYDAFASFDKDPSLGSVMMMGNDVPNIGDYVLVCWCYVGGRPLSFVQVVEVYDGSNPDSWFSSAVREVVVGGSAMMYEIWHLTDGGFGFQVMYDDMGSVEYDVFRFMGENVWVYVKYDVASIAKAIAEPVGDRYLVDWDRDDFCSIVYRYGKGVQVYDVGIRAARQLLRGGNFADWYDLSCVKDGVYLCVSMYDGWTYDYYDANTDESLPSQSFLSCVYVDRVYNRLDKAYAYHERNGLVSEQYFEDSEYHGWRLCEIWHVNRYFCSVPVGSLELRDAASDIIASLKNEVGNC